MHVIALLNMQVLMVNKWTTQEVVLITLCTAIMSSHNAPRNVYGDITCYEPYLKLIVLIQNENSYKVTCILWAFIKLFIMLYEFCYNMILCYEQDHHSKGHRIFLLLIYMSLCHIGE